MKDRSIPIEDLVDGATTPVYFGKSRALFGWMHLPETCRSQCPIILCVPVGMDYVRAYRSFRILAESLQSAGFPVLRFDYYGTGDSAGGDDSGEQVEGYLASIEQAIDFVGSRIGASKPILIGLRLGATLAADISGRCELGGLVLWNPCFSGQTFVREMQIVASAGANDGRACSPLSNDEGVDAAGFTYSEPTIARLRQLTLNKFEPLQPLPVLLIERDDLPASDKLSGLLAQRTSDVESVRLAGFKKMMLAPQFSVVPTKTIECIRNWCSKNFAENESSLAKWEMPSGSAESGKISENQGLMVLESAIRFGADQHLFGILGRPKTVVNDVKPAIVMLCGGSVHRIGANRMYVPIARRLAGLGFDVLRMDLSGIGDSRPIEGEDWNKPYARNLNDDVVAGMDMIESKTGRTEFVLLGLCSGAFAAFSTTKSCSRVVGLCLINQLVYYLAPALMKNTGNADRTSGHAQDYPRHNSLGDRILRQCLRYARQFGGGVGRFAANRAIGGDLAGDLAEFATRDIDLHFVFAERDPAEEALMLYAGRFVNRLVETGSAQMSVVANADHVFSRAQAKRDVMDKIVEHLSRRFS